MTTNTKNNSAVVDTLGQRMIAIKKYIKGAKTEIPLAGTIYKPADVVAHYQTTIDVRRLVVTKRAELQSAILERTTSEATHKAVDAGLKAWVINSFGVDSTEAHDFGFGPRKPPQKTAETKATAVKKLRATREARHTMGKIQKKGIKGSIVQAAPVVGAAPVVAGPAPVVAAQPAAAPVSVVVNNGAQPAAAASSGNGAPGAVSNGAAPAAPAH